MMINNIICLLYQKYTTKYHPSDHFPYNTKYKFIPMIIKVSNNERSLVSRHNNPSNQQHNNLNYYYSVLFIENYYLKFCCCCVVSSVV